MMTGMTPEEAQRFDVEDEDAAAVFAWFDAGPTGVTAQRSASQEPVPSSVVRRVLASGLYGSLGRDLFPQRSEVSAAGSNTRYAAQA